MFVFGTRPEAIKLAPIIKEIKFRNKFDVKIVVTGQHKEMLEQVLDLFDIVPDYDLGIMKENQTLSEIVTNTIDNINDILDSEKPDLILIQGDTSSALATVLAAFYKRIKIAHVEAGLRTHDRNNPFPEEINRTFISYLADMHFAPTSRAVNNLMKEGFTNNVFLTGNSIVDAYKMILKSIPKSENNKVKKKVVVTAHRRENFGENMISIFQAIKTLAERNYKNVEFIVMRHKNPNVSSVIDEYLKGVDGVTILDPLNYLDFIKLLLESDFIISDSGGIQEEAACLNKKVLLLREVTERQEAVDGGWVKIIGTKFGRIIDEAEMLLKKIEELDAICEKNPYGVGNTSNIVCNFLENFFMNEVI